jgi:hypothetical protein
MSCSSAAATTSSVANGLVIRDRRSAARATAWACVWQWSNRASNRVCHGNAARGSDAIRLSLADVGVSKGDLDAGGVRRRGSPRLYGTSRRQARIDQSRPRLSSAPREPRGELTGVSFGDWLDFDERAVSAALVVPRPARVSHVRSRCSGPSQKPCRRLVFNLTGALQ